MLEKIIEWDEQLFLYLNAYRADWLDPIMLALTGSAIWIPLYIFIMYMAFREFGKGTFWVLVGIGIAILLADQGTSSVMKPYFGRLRPCHDARWEDQIYNYKHCGGMYGFASSHASNGFAVATYFALVFYRRVKGFGLLFLWAAMFAYTRVYLGVHYPLDIIVGGFVGMLSALIGYLISEYLKKYYQSKVHFKN